MAVMIALSSFSGDIIPVIRQLSIFLLHPLAAVLKQ
jgi:hypothetical protein